MSITPESENASPLCVDLFCGLGGWSEGFLAEGWRVVGFDIERHRYPAREMAETTARSGGGIDFNRGDSFNGTNEKRLRDAPLTGKWAEYPGQLVLQDVLTIHGSQFRNASCIVASPPCQEYSYMAMPWTRAKQIAAALRAEGEFPQGYAGSRTIEQLNALFNACFRIQREACEAAGRYIPMVVENVKGAQPWVGRAKANYGSFYLWGDVESVGGRIVASGRLAFGATAVKAAARGMKRNPDGTEHPQGSWFKVADSVNRGAQVGVKVDGFNFHQHEKNGKGGSFQSAAVKNCGGSCLHELAASGSKGFVTGLGKGHDWRQDPTARFNSKSDSRKAASAQIAKIPLELARHIARVYHP